MTITNKTAKTANTKTASEKREEAIFAAAVAKEVEKAKQELAEKAEAERQAKISEIVSSDSTRSDKAKKLEALDVAASRISELLPKGNAFVAYMRKQYVEGDFTLATFSGKSKEKAALYFANIGMPEKISKNALSHLGERADNARAAQAAFNAGYEKAKAEFSGK